MLATMQSQSATQRRDDRCGLSRPLRPAGRLGKRCKNAAERSTPHPFGLGRCFDLPNWPTPSFVAHTSRYALCGLFCAHLQGRPLAINPATQIDQPLPNEQISTSSPGGCRKRTTYIMSTAISDGSWSPRRCHAAMNANAITPTSIISRAARLAPGRNLALIVGLDRPVDDDPAGHDYLNLSLALSQRLLDTPHRQVALAAPQAMGDLLAGDGPCWSITSSCCSIPSCRSTRCAR